MKLTQPVVKETSTTSYCPSFLSRQVYIRNPSLISRVSACDESVCVCCQLVMSVCVCVRCQQSPYMCHLTQHSYKLTGLHTSATGINYTFSVKAVNKVMWFTGDV